MFRRCVWRRCFTIWPGRRGRRSWWRWRRPSGLRSARPESRMPIFLHGPVAAEMARGRYGIEDGEILEAVRAHTTGLAGMGPVARAVFLADKLDPTKDRRYPFNGRVREMAGRDLDGALLAFLDGEIAGREAGGGVVHPASVGLREGLG